MPHRPPKSWFDRCTAHVRRRGGKAVRSVRAICGRAWANLSEAEKRRTTRREERRQ